MESFRNARVLITGGLGFIGSNLARRLVEAGARVTLVDSLIPEYGGNLFNVEDLRGKVTVNIADVRDEHSMKHLVLGQDVLFNLAGQTSHMDSMQHPITDLEINAKAQLYILEACRRSNPGVKIVFASTRQIYGKPDYLPVDERHPLRPVDINGVNKLAGEWYHLLYHSVYGVRTTILRLTNTIGPGMRVKDARQTFVGVWVRALMEGKPFEVWGGEQLRDFNDVDDVVTACLLVAARDEANGRVFNLGGKEVVSLDRLAELLVAANGGGSFVRKEFPPERKKIDIGDFYADASLIRTTIGWEPTVTLSDTLARTASYYRQHLAQYL
jgi:UDP-glucose 4-epimerase